MRLALILTWIRICGSVYVFAYGSAYGSAYGTAYAFSYVFTQLRTELRTELRTQVLRYWSFLSRPIGLYHCSQIMELIFGDIRIRVKVTSDKEWVIEWGNIPMTHILGNFGHPCFGGLSVVSCSGPSCRCNLQAEPLEDFGPSSYPYFPSEQMHVFLKMLC